MKPMFDAKKFGNRLKRTMVKRKLSVRKAADEIGVSFPAVNKISNGARPDIESYFRIEKWLSENESRS